MRADVSEVSHHVGASALVIDFALGGREAMSVMPVGEGDRGGAEGWIAIVKQPVKGVRSSVPAEEEVLGEQEDESSTSRTS